MPAEITKYFWPCFTLTASISVCHADISIRRPHFACLSPKREQSQSVSQPIRHAHTMYSVCCSVPCALLRFSTQLKFLLGGYKCCPRSPASNYVILTSASHEVISLNKILSDKPAVRVMLLESIQHFFSKLLCVIKQLKVSMCACVRVRACAFRCHAATHLHSIILRSIKRCGYPGRRESCLSVQSLSFYLFFVSRHLVAPPDLSLPSYSLTPHLPSPCPLPSSQSPALLISQWWWRLSVSGEILAGCLSPSFIYLPEPGLWFLWSTAQ